jgi:MFS family permease
MFANVFVGLGVSLVTNICITMLTEFVPNDSSGVAVSVFVRYSVACIGTVASFPMLDAMGSGWCFTFWALLGLISGIIIYALRKLAPRGRQKDWHGSTSST